MKWFRLYSSVLNDPKVQRLSGSLFKRWINLLCLACEHEQAGTLPGPSDIAFKLRLTDAEVSAMIETLHEKNLVEIDGETVRIHDWDQWQTRSDSDRTSAERQRRYRAKNKGCNGDRNALRLRDVTHAEVEVEVEVEKEVYNNGKVVGNGMVVARAHADGTQQPEPQPITRPNQTEPVKEVTEETIKAIVALYHEILPMCPRVTSITAKLREQLTRRVTEDDFPILDHWRRYFSDVAKCNVLTGRTPPKPGYAKPFVASLQWLTTDSMMQDIYRGKYFTVPGGPAHVGLH